jgi:hypothetical protein
MSCGVSLDGRSCGASAETTSPSCTRYDAARATVLSRTLCSSIQRCACEREIPARAATA